MGEIRIVGLGKIRGYPYPVCENIKCSFKHLVLKNISSASGTF